MANGALPKRTTEATLNDLASNYADFRKRDNIALVGLSETGKTSLRGLVVRTLLNKGNDWDIDIIQTDGWIETYKVLDMKLENPKNPSFPDPTPSSTFSIHPFQLKISKFWGKRPVEIYFNDVGGEFYDISKDWEKINLEEDRAKSLEFLEKLLKKGSINGKPGPFANLLFAGTIVVLFDYGGDDFLIRWKQCISNYGFILSALALRNRFIGSNTDKFNCRIGIVFTKADLLEEMGDKKNLEDPEHAVNYYLKDLKNIIESLEPADELRCFKVGIMTEKKKIAVTDGKLTEKRIPKLSDRMHIQPYNEKEMYSFLKWLFKIE